MSHGSIRRAALTAPLAPALAAAGLNAAVSTVAATTAADPILRNDVISTPSRGRRRGRGRMLAVPGRLAVAVAAAWPALLAAGWVCVSCVDGCAPQPRCPGFPI